MKQDKQDEDAPPRGGPGHGGASSELFRVSVAAVEVHPASTRIMYTYAAKPDLGLIRSEDGGKRWVGPVDLRPCTSRRTAATSIDHAMEGDPQSSGSPTGRSSLHHSADC